MRVVEERRVDNVGRNADWNDMCIRLKWKGRHDTLRLKRSFLR